MRKFILPFLFAGVMCLPACSDDNEPNPEPQPESETRVLTFEDADFKAGTTYIGTSNWSSLIDEPQYGGPLLYPDAEDAKVYQWSDDNNTFLSHKLPNSYGDNAYWGGGHAVSNYVCTDDVNDVTYERQLEVYASGATEGHGGHNGSANFAVHNGWKDASASYMTLPSIEFSDGVEREIQYMYVAPVAYMASYVYSDAFKGTYVDIVATGFDKTGAEVASSVFHLMADGALIDGWTKWDLKSLGAVASVAFNVVSDDMGEYGLNVPAYFAYDDVAVTFPL